MADAIAEKGFEIGGACAPQLEPQMRNRSLCVRGWSGRGIHQHVYRLSPIMIDGALVLPDVSVGMIEASAIRRPAMP